MTVSVDKHQRPFLTPEKPYISIQTNFTKPNLWLLEFQGLTSNITANIFSYCTNNSHQTECLMEKNPYLPSKDLVDSKLNCLG